MQSPEAIAGFAKIEAGQIENLTANERVAVCSYYMAATYTTENSYFQYRDGFLPESHWQRIRRMLKVVLKSDPGTKLCFESTSFLVRDEFASEIEQIISEIQKQ
jgi:hypothetical protein